MWSMDKSRIILLEDIDKRWKQIADHYESLFGALDRKGNVHEEESLFWEEETFAYIWTILMAQRIEFNAGKDDVRPVVFDENGTKIEIDFRLFINEKPIYFDITHFSGRHQDLNKDKQSLDVAIHDFKTSDAKVESNNGLGNPRIVSVRSQKEYLNRRIAVRVAKEGRHKLSLDHVYIFIPKLDIGFGGGIDSIPVDFDFDKSSSYTYKETSIKGIILIGAYTECTKSGSRIHEDKLIVRAKVLPNCSPLTAGLLKQIDHTILDLSKIIASFRHILGHHKNNLQ